VTTVPGGRLAFEYALLRAVPRVDRGECLNVGVVLYCQGAEYLKVLLHLEESRLRALDPAVDVDLVRAALAAVAAVCAGDVRAGPAAGRSQRERFGWLTAPRSTVVQAGPVHSGVTHDPEAQLQRLLDRLVKL
jgi:hypothetical protein